MSATKSTLRVLALSGSLRKASSNTGMLRAAVAAGPAHGMIIDVQSTDLPLYNGDVEAAGFPLAVAALREHAAAADAILIASPEYNYSFSGVLVRDPPMQRCPRADRIHPHALSAGACYTSYCSRGGTRPSTYCYRAAVACTSSTPYA
jgi:multimeric flavodoxin WrbA